QPFSTLRFNSCNHFANVDFLGRAAVETLLDFGTQCLEFGLAPLFALFDEPKPLANDLTCGRIAAALDQAFDHPLEVFADAIAACHFRTFEYQYVISNAIGYTASQPCHWL